MRRILYTVLAAAMVLAGTITAAVAATGTKPEVRVVATRLNAPKHLLYAAGGVYVVESGKGGPAGTKDCVTGPATEGPGTTQYCEGLTGAIAVIKGTGAKVVDSKLPSVIEEDSGEVAGPSAVSVGAKVHLSVLFQDVLVNKNGATAVKGPSSKLFGTFQIAHGVSANLARFDSRHPEAAATLGGLPGETAYDSDPYDVTPYRGGYAVTDAAANALLDVSAKGKISLLARFPTEAENVPAGVLGPTALTVDAQAVPTSVAVGPDGSLYVGILRGVPSAPGTADVFRVTRGHAPKVWASGLTAVTAIAFDSKGRLLATELSTGGLLAPDKVPGALVRISANGKHVTTLPVSGLFDPTGVAVAPNGAVYVSNYGTSTASAKKPGEVLKITGLG